MSAESATPGETRWSGWRPLEGLVRAPEERLAAAHSYLKGSRPLPSSTLSSSIQIQSLTPSSTLALAHRRLNS
eukprot:6976578-Pyramimonas_sp.AAC.1